MRSAKSGILFITIVRPACSERLSSLGGDLGTSHPQVDSVLASAITLRQFLSRSWLRPPPEGHVHSEGEFQILAQPRRESRMPW